ncbi:MAG: hypothetical protein WBE26_16145 [Phycisphaerae bacterium]
MSSSRRYIVLGVSLLGVTASVTGCSLMVNPFTDELAGQPAVTTVSVDAARAVAIEATVTQRLYASTSVPAKDGTVTHGPLYFEDPFEKTGSEDGSFAWSKVDYVYWLYGPARFLVNTALFPISAGAAPPWVVTASDGQSGRR